MSPAARGSRGWRAALTIALTAALVATTLGLAEDSTTAEAATLPSVPTAVNAVAAQSSITVSWTAPALDGGAPITGYVVTPWLDYIQLPKRTFTSNATTQVLTGITRGWRYRYTVAAITSVGTGPASKVSNLAIAGVAAPPPPTTFVHPGVLVSKADLDFVRAKIAAGQQPWKAAYDNALGSYSSASTPARPTRYRYSSLAYKAAPVAAIQAGSDGSEAYMAAHPELGLKSAGGVEHLDDAQAAYTHALLWAYTGNVAYAKKAIEIMDAWSAKLTEIKFDQPRRLDTGGLVYGNGKLQAGWGGSLFARAAEIIRHTGGGWTTTGVTRFETMLRNVYLPLTIDGWNNTPNWMMTLAEATMGIGVFLNDRPAFDAGVAMWRDKVPTTIYMATDGPLPEVPADHYDTTAEIKALWYNPTTFVSGLQGETLRDISHMAFGLGAMSNAAATASIQGIDLFQAEQARIVAAYERNAAWVNQYLDQVAARGGSDPPSTWKPAGWVGPAFKVGGLGYRGGWEIAYEHYGKVLKINMPQTAKLVARLRPSQPLFHSTWETLTHAR